jgi:hypothetical protein
VAFKGPSLLSTTAKFSFQECVLFVNNFSFQTGTDLSHGGVNCMSCHGVMSVNKIDTIIDQLQICVEGHYVITVFLPAFIYSL